MMDGIAMYGSNMRRAKERAQERVLRDKEFDFGLVWADRPWQPSHSPATPTLRGRALSLLRRLFGGWR